MAECRGVGDGPEFGWVEVKIDADMTAAQIQTAVEKAMAEDGDVPVGEVARFRRQAMKVGVLRSAIKFVKVYKEVRSVGVL